MTKGRLDVKSYEKSSLAAQFQSEKEIACAAASHWAEQLFCIKGMLTDIFKTVKQKSCNLLVIKLIIL